MKKAFPIFFLLDLLLANSLYSQVAPPIEWQKCFGGTHGEEAYSIQQISDNGFIVAGRAFSNDSDVSGNHGSDDYWIVKLSSDGTLLWQKALGGSSVEAAYCVQQTADGGFIVAGISQSNNGDVSGNINGNNYWIVKIDSGGNLLWQKPVGGSGFDQPQSIQETTDGGFIIAGFSQSNDGDVTGHHGCSNADTCSDYWVVKLSSTGNIIWQKSLGGSGDDRAYSVQQTTDGGFIVAGSSASHDGDVSGNHGDYDYWIVRLDSLGNIEWQKSLGGGFPDVARSVQQTSDGGFVIAGSAASFDGDVTGNHECFYYNGCTDYWITKLNTNGDLMWEKAFGGKGVDDAYSVQQTSEGGFIVAGASASFDGDVTGHHGGYYDYWILKLDVNGNLIWEYSYGGGGIDDATAIQQTTDGGFIIAGYTYSNDYDVSGNHGSRDYWIVKLKSDSVTGIASQSKNFISLYPNPVQDRLFVNLTFPVNSSGDVSIRVYDFHGRMIELPATFQKIQAQLNTSTLTNGIYTLQVFNNKTGESAVGRVVKAK